MPFLISQAFISLVVFVIASGLCAALRRTSAAQRHLIWAAAFASLLVIPLLANLLPASERSTPVQVLMVTSVAAETVLSQDPAQTSSPWRTLLGWTWVIGTALLLLEVVVGVAICAHRRRRAVPYSTDLIESSTADVRISGAVSVPETFGLFRPAILLPEQARNWTADRLQVALLHELVHIKRRDWAVHLMARVAASLFWFNPLCWYAGVR
jgi:beta-lactamase regulating signal transducer with metallopeptidase domain